MACDKKRTISIEESLGLFQSPSAVHSQELDSIHHLFSRKYLGAESEAPDAFAQTQTVHLGKDHAMVLLALQALLGRDFDKVMVVSEERSPKCARLGQLRLICRSKLPFLICGSGFNASPSQFLGDTHIHILIGVES